MPAFALYDGSECGECLASLRKGRQEGYWLHCWYCEYKVKLVAGGRELDVLPVGCKVQKSVDAVPTQHNNSALEESSEQR